MKLWKLLLTYKKLRTFVESGKAQDIYLLQENGVPLAENQREITPFQRQVLVQEKIRQNEKQREEMNQNSNNRKGPSSRQINTGPRNSKSSRVQAIKDSQEEEEKFVNTSVVDTE